MTFDEIRNIVGAGENPRLEIKRDTPKASVLAYHIVRFANNNGGRIVVGFNDDGSVKGINYKIVQSSLEKAKSLYQGETQIFLDHAKNEQRKEVAVISVAKALKPLKLDSKLFRRSMVIELPDGERVNELFVDGNDKENKENKKESIGNPSEDVVLQHLSLSHLDSNVKPCFGIDILVNAFSDMLSEASIENLSNTCFFGIFGKWGRGKSYFLNRFKRKIEKDFSSDYKYVEVNAWKFHRTPEIWFYLYDILLKSKSRCFRFWYKSWINWKVVILFLSYILVLGIAFWASFMRTDSSSSEMGLAACLTGCVALAAGVWAYINGAFDLVSKRMENFVFKDGLGVQYEMEKRLEHLIKYWESGWFNCCLNSKAKRRIVLAVEDIDRCDKDSMIDVIEALKLVLENEYIRKRLLVVVSVDCEKLIEAYIQKFRKSADDKKSYDLAVGQMDKIFLAGINLPELSRSDQKEYVDNIASIHRESLVSVPIEALNSSENSSITGSSDINNSDQELSEKIDETQEILVRKLVKQKNIDAIISILKRAIDKGSLNSEPPRKLRIIFYRMLLANNLLTLRSEPFDTKLMSQIIEESISSKASTGTLNQLPLLKVVVPYSAS